MISIASIERIFPQKKIYRLATLLLMSVMVFLGLWIFFTLPLNQNLHRLRPRIQQVQASLAQQQTMIKQWGKHSDKPTETAEPMSAKIRPLHLSQLLEQLAVLSQADGLQMRSMQPLEQSFNHGLLTQPIKLEIWGDFPQLLKFLTELSKLPFLIALQDFQFTSSLVHSRSNQVVMDVVLKIYSGSAVILKRSEESP